MFQGASSSVGYDILPQYQVAVPRTSYDTSFGSRWV